jgi:hypothetical protein
MACLVAVVCDSAASADDARRGRQRPVVEAKAYHLEHVSCSEIRTQLAKMFEHKSNPNKIECFEKSNLLLVRAWSTDLALIEQLVDDMDSRAASGKTAVGGAGRKSNFRLCHARKCPGV